MERQPGAADETAANLRDYLITKLQNLWLGACQFTG